MPSISETRPFHKDALAATLGATAKPGTAPDPLGSTMARTTVLPSPATAGGGAAMLAVDAGPGRARYEHLKPLGAGGMGEVDLVKDNDIGRRVAVKRLVPGANNADGLGRFIDEIRTIGRLEHPNIIPIHDVGLDGDGRYFFVMKYVDGDTLESIIAKLAAGDPIYRAKYTFEYRIQIFIGLLRALQYAHQHGIVHRDLKPANVMVGEFGEVVLMDWGIAKAVRDGHDQPVMPTADAGGDATTASPARLYTTRHGSLVGTPAYMSPEQASGRNELIDERSDIYSASVLFFELIFLRHYLGDKQTITAMLAGVLADEPTFLQVGLSRHPHQAPVPAELTHFVLRGMRKDPGKRWCSAAQMLEELEAILEGRVKIQCHVTFTKRMARELGRFVDRFPHVAFGGMVAMVGYFGYTLFRAFGR